MSVVDLTEAALLAPPRDRIASKVELFTELGWHTELKGSRESQSLSLMAAGMPQILVTTSTGRSEAVSLAYSNEAPLTLSWTESELRLSRTEIWREVPGDSSIAVADDEPSTFQLLHAIARVRYDGLLGATQEGSTHRRLADQLAEAFAHLRAQVAEMEGRAFDEAQVFQLFHQLLFVRFHEDRFGPVDSAGLISDILTQPSPIDGLMSVLAGYRSRFNSELFGMEIAVDRMPTQPVLEVAEAMVEPWNDLRLNFSVAHSDVGGRLYQSFLARTPAVETEGRLFPVSINTDRQRERGAFFTPQPVAELLVHRVLDDVLERSQPASFAGVSVLDPACGSGAFLLAAFRTVRRYFEGKLGRQLTEDERLELLSTCLYGGDDDETAVALTRIQLLEEAEVDRHRLPELGANIGRHDLLDGDLSEAPAGWRRVMQAGGFLAILSNPPFHSPRGAQRAGIDTVDLARRYQSAKGTGWNLAGLFFEAALPLLSGAGRVGMLLPQSVLDGPSGLALRRAVSDDRLVEVIDFGRNQLFSPTMAYVAAVIADARRSESATVLSQTATSLRPLHVIADVLRGVGDEPQEMEGATFSERVSAGVLNEGESWSPFIVRWNRLLRDHVGAAVVRFDGPAAPKVAIGTQTGSDRTFVFDRDRWSADGDRVTIDHRFAVPGAYAPWWVRGGDIRPFLIGELRQRVVVPQLGEDPAVDELIRHLGGVPSSFRPGNLELLRSPKVIVRGLFDEPAAVADVKGQWMIPQGGAGVVALVPSRVADVQVLEGLLNSALYQWLLQGIAHPKSHGYVQLMRHHWDVVPWPVLRASQRKQVVEAARSVKSSMRAGDRNRVSRYWDARVELDTLVFDVLGVSAVLRTIVSNELWRKA